MQRHILDTNRPYAESGRATAYLRLDQARRPQAATLQLQHRARKGRMDMRLKQFIRVARGHTA